MDAFGKYQLLYRLATGGMAEIFLARQTGAAGFEKLLVVKRILPQFSGQREFVQMFLDEARLAATLNHPNVVQIYDLGEAEGTYFIAMEFIAGQDLLGVIKRSSSLGLHVPPNVAARIVAGACEGLHYAHAHKNLRGEPLNLVHRDISPSNILVTYSGGVKVVDFGIARAETRATVTEAGVVKGKLSYMSPEQALGRPLDRRSDIFALGIVLHETLLGRRLFNRESQLAILNDILNGNVKMPSQLMPELPRELDLICQRALHRDRTQRYDDAGQMQAALERWLATQPNPTGSAEVAAYMGSVFAAEVAASQRLLELPAAPSDQVPVIVGVLEALTREEKLLPESHFLSDGGAVEPASAPTSATPIRAQRRRRQTTALVAVALISVALGVGVATYPLWATAPRPQPALPRPVPAVEPSAKTPARLEAPIAVAEPPTPAPQRDAGLKPMSRPAVRLVEFELTTEPRTEIFIDGKSHGWSPAKLQLSPGRHKATFVSTDPDLHCSRELKVQSDDGPVRQIIFQKGAVRVLAAEADVFLAKQRIGQSPIAKFELFECTHELKLVSGSVMKTVNVVIEPGQVTNVSEHFE